MTNDAIELLPDEARQAAAAVAALEITKGEPATPAEIHRIADLLGADRATVLALFGYLHTRDSRSNRYVFASIRTGPALHHDSLVWPEQGTPAAAALAICREVHSYAIH